MTDSQRSNQILPPPSPLTAVWSQGSQIYWVDGSPVTLKIVSVKLGPAEYMKITNFPKPNTLVNFLVVVPNARI